MKNKSKLVEVNGETIKFHKKQDENLCHYLSIHSIPETRRAAPMYAALGPQASDDLAWSRCHSATAWQARYLSQSKEFDGKIAALARQRELERLDKSLRRRNPTAPPVIKTVGSSGKKTRPAPYPLPAVNRVLSTSVANSITTAITGPTRSRMPTPQIARAPSPTPSVMCIDKPIQPASEQKKDNVKSTVPRCPPDCTCPAAAAVAARAIHKKLAEIARTQFDGMFSIDFVWKAYADLGGDFALVEALLDEMKQEIDAMFVED